MTNPTHNSRLLQAAVSGGLGAMLAAIPFLFIPFTLYSGNLDEFTVPFTRIAGHYLPFALIFAGLASLLGMLLPRGIFDHFSALLAILAILAWLQSNILVWDYGLLDGRSIDWKVEPWRGWVDTGIWIGGIAGALFAARSAGRRLIHLAVAIFVIQLVLLGYTWLTHQQQLAAKENNPLTVAGPEALYGFSSTKNIVHIIADGFQSDIFEEIIQQSPEGARYAAVLDGFVFFPENMGVFPYTHMTIPAIMSGRIYRNHVPIAEHLDVSMGDKSILKAAHDAGYEVDMAVPYGLASMYGRAPSAHLYPIPEQRHISAREFEIYDSARLMDLSLFRSLPHLVKPYVYNDQRWLVQSFMSDSEYMRRSFFFAYLGFLRDLNQNITAHRQRPVYKLLHLMLSHNPMVTTRDCEYAGGILPTVRKTVMIQAECGLAEVVRLFEQMKRLGIYDDATIILMADHGAWVPPSHLNNKRTAKGGFVPGINPSIVALAAPLLAIKEAGARGPLRVSRAPTWIPDVAPAIASMAGFQESFPGRSALDIPPDSPRERQFYYYRYNRAEWSADYLSPIREFVIKGSVFDTADWHKKAKFPPRWAHAEQE